MVQVVEVIDDLAGLALNQGSTQGLLFYFFVFQQTECGSNDLAGGPIPTRGDRPLDEVIEVVAQGDGCVLGHAGALQEITNSW